jgi:uncharacterized membrane protein
MFISFIEEAGKSLILSPSQTGFEDTISNLVLWIKVVVELIGAVLIGVGAVLAVARLLRVFRRPTIGGYEKTRLIMARFLSLGLEFQLAADILASAVSPSWTQIGKLGAIAAIRTGLNYFLAREIDEEKEAIDDANPATSEVKPTL